MKGGKREGAGRKVKADELKRVRYNFTLTPDRKAFLKNISKNGNAAKWLEEAIDEKRNK